MATHASAEKAARQAVKRTVRNVTQLSACKTAVRKLRTALSKTKSKDEAKKVLIPLLNDVQSILMSTAKKGILRRTTVSRQISRLSMAVHRAQQA